MLAALAFATSLNLVWCLARFRNEEALANSRCPKQVELRWQTEVSSSIYATPLITDLNTYSPYQVPHLMTYRFHVFETAELNCVPCRGCVDNYLKKSSSCYYYIEH
jgi:hypothetical protein